MRGKQKSCHQRTIFATETSALVSLTGSEREKCKYRVYKVVIEIEIDLRKTEPTTPRGSWRSFLLLQKWDLQTVTPLPLARGPPFARIPPFSRVLSLARVRPLAGVLPLV